MKVLIAGGGTTGHVSPAIAAAAELQRRGAEIIFVGTASGPEARLVPAAGFPFRSVKVTGRSRRTLSPRNLRAALNLGTALLRCRRIVDEFGPAVVLGTGGYVSLPALFAAKMKNVPVVIHEQNSVPGLANRLGGRFAQFVAVSFPGTEKLFGPRARLVGNPVRPDLEYLDRTSLRNQASRHFGFEPEVRTLLIFGGSQGAASINRAAFAAYRRLRNLRLQVLHICGPEKLGEAAATLSSTREADDVIVWRLLGYCDRMDLAYASADLAICRAGASTIAELAAVGLPAVLVPYPGSIDEDQRHNAEAVVASGGARMVADSKLTGDVLVDATQRLLLDESALNRMGHDIRTLAAPGAACELADLVFQAGA